jgi:hypothetical protein
MPTETLNETLLGPVLVQELDANLLSKQLLVPIQENLTSSCLPYLGKLNIDEITSSISLNLNG